MKCLTEKEGSIFFIPLFLEKGIKDNRKSYSKYNFEKQEKYAFGRLIEIDKSNGDLIEIFNYIGSIPDANDVIINSGRMFNPLHMAMGFKQKRYRFIFDNTYYNKSTDSGYEEIGFQLANSLWKGGKEIKDISEEQLSLYDEMIVYPSTKLEKKIIGVCCPEEL